MASPAAWYAARSRHRARPVKAATTAADHQHMTGDPKEAPLWAHRRSRWVRSDVTFGPVGRIAVSLLMLVPLWWFIAYAGVFGIVGVPIWLVKVLPWALRDIWRPVRLRATDADLIRAQHELLEQAEAAPAHASIHDRSPVSRW